MPLQSDVTINAKLFNPATVSKQASQFNEYLIGIGKASPSWYEVGAAKYRAMRWAGETALPAPRVLEQGVNIKIPSRDPGRDIPCRVMFPSARKTEEERKKCKGVVVHFHGGGWVLGDERSTDPLLLTYADVGDLAVVSVGYRHAPEDPFPKGPQDCFDAGEYLVRNSEKEYGGPLLFIGGESAGGHLSLLTTFHLLKIQPTFKPIGLLLHFGCYNFTQLPSVTHFTKPLVLNKTILDHFFDAFVPGTTTEERKDPSISPYYEDLERFRGRLPAALFTIGTEDPLLDDSIAMGTKWLMAGGEAIIKVYPGAAHGFIGFPSTVLKEAGEALDDTKTFIEDCLRKL